MGFQVGEAVEVEVGDVAQGGWCVARPPGLPVVFVRHALPGERVVAQVTEVTSRFARADAVEILLPSPDRVPAPCPYAHAGGCGGCDWQHATLPAQRALKAAVIGQHLRRLAGIDREVTVEPTRPQPMITICTTRPFTVSHALPSAPNRAPRQRYALTWENATPETGNEEALPSGLSGRRGRRSRGR